MWYKCALHMATQLQILLSLRHQFNKENITLTPPVSPCLFPFALPSPYDLQSTTEANDMKFPMASAPTGGVVPICNSNLHQYF